MLPLLLVSLWPALPLAQSTLPGQPAAEYTDGSFAVPGAIPSFWLEGDVMSVEWTTIYERSNLFIITGEDFATSSRMIEENYPCDSVCTLDWTVGLELSTDPNNSSQTYVMRVVDALGNETAQTQGGFLSARFFIRPNLDNADNDDDESSSSQSSTASPTSSLTSPVFEAPSSTATPTSEPEPAQQSNGLTPAAKGAIGAGVSVGVIGIAALCLAFFYWRRSRRLGGNQAAPEQAQHPPESWSEYKYSAQPQAEAGDHAAGSPSELPNSQISELPQAPKP